MLGAGGSMDCESMERFVIRILALVERSEDTFIRTELMRIADDLAGECRRARQERQSQSH
jgi:hypothetical protein